MNKDELKQKIIESIEFLINNTHEAITDGCITIEDYEAMQEIMLNLKQGMELLKGLKHAS